MTHSLGRPTPVGIKRVASVLGALGLGVVGGFTASLLRRRPPTVYAAGLSPTATSGPDSNDTGPDELPQTRPDERGA